MYLNNNKQSEEKKLLKDEGWVTPENSTFAEVQEKPVDCWLDCDKAAVAEDST